MSGYDGQVGAVSTSWKRPDLLRTVINDESGTTLILGAQGRRLAGAVLDLSQGESDLRILLVGEDGETILRLGPFGEEDVIAIWRSIIAAAGLTPMMRACDGHAETLATQLGRVTLGPVRDRRRLAVLNRRRPRFLTRRKIARLPPRPLVFREREIATGRGS